MLRILIVALLCALPLKAAAESYLLMAEEVGCLWCARWNAEIAPIYEKTPEGQTAPLIRYDLHADSPDVEFKHRVRFSPTFILVHNGKEVGRIEGYPGEDFFWGLLGRMIADAEIELDQAS